MPLPKYCSVAATLKAPGWDRAAPPWDLAFTCPFALRAPWLPGHRALPRHSSYHPCLHIADPAWQGPGWLGRAGEAADTWVLARREPDGFYYRAQIKAAPELERRGILLVEFEAPPVLGPKLPSQRQCVVLEEDVIQLSPFVDYSLRPGDKVLAPWEPEQQRYGPGTVLWDLQPRDSQRASKEKEITVYFWNGKTAKVPPSGVRWVPPAVWMKAVERLQEPGTREHPSPLFWAPCCSLLEPATGCITSRPPLEAPFLCPCCLPQACCLCCCPLMGPTWWPLTGTSEATATQLTESEIKPTAQQLLPLEAPREEAEAVPAALAVSSSHEEEDSEDDLERLMVSSAVHTDPTLPEMSPRQSGPCQPAWRYWRRNGPEPRPGKPVASQAAASGKQLFLRSALPTSDDMKRMVPKSSFHSFHCLLLRPSLEKENLNLSNRAESVGTTETAPDPTSGGQGGTRRWNTWKEKDNKQQRVQTAVVGTTKELALKATNMKPPQTLSEEAKHRKPSQGIQARPRGKNSPQTKSPEDVGS